MASGSAGEQPAVDMHFDLSALCVLCFMCPISLVLSPFIEAKKERKKQKGSPPCALLCFAALFGHLLRSFRRVKRYKSKREGRYNNTFIFYFHPPYLPTQFHLFFFDFYVSSSVTCPFLIIHIFLIVITTQPFTPMATVSPLTIPEILGLILGSRVLTPEDLAQTSLVCKTWSVISRQSLWQVLELDTESWEDPFYHRLVAQLEQHGPAVRTLIIRECVSLYSFFPHTRLFVPRRRRLSAHFNVHIKSMIQGSDKSRFNAMLARVTNLQEILVDKIMLYQRSHVLQGLDRLPYRQLRHLRLPHVASASGIELLLKVCNAGYGIQNLELMDSDIDDATLQIIAELCPKLKSLDLSRNEVITFTEFFQGIEEDEESKTLEICTPSSQETTSASLPLGLSGLAQESLWTKDTLSTNTSTRKMAYSPHSNMYDPYCLLCCSVLDDSPVLYHQQQTQQRNMEEHGGREEQERHLWSSLNQSRDEQTPCQHLAQYPQECQQQQDKDISAQTQTQIQQGQTKKTNHPISCSASSFDGPTAISLPPHSLLHRTSSLLQDDAPFTYLEELNLVFCFGITDRDFQRLFRFFRGKSLRALNLQFTNIEDSGLEALARTFYPTPTSTGGLTSLKVSYCNKITAKGIRTLVNQCPQLLELEFLSCDQVSAECFMGRPWACTQLQRLEFTLHPMVVLSEKRGDDETEGGEQEVSHPQEQEQVQQSLQKMNYEKHPQPPQQQQRTEDKEQENFDKEGHGHNSNGAPHDQELSVRRDYHAMFRQIKRLRQLRALHIYNSPLLNSKTHPSDQAEEGGEGEEGAVPAWVNVVFVDPSMPDATVGGTEVESGSSSTSLDNHSSHEVAYPMHSRQNSGMEVSSSHGQEEEPLASPPPFTSVPLAPSISSSSSSSSSSSTSSPSPSSPLPFLSHAHQLEAIHPFHLASGLKALKTLQQLHTLTLYERCSVKLPGPEVRWIGAHLPQLRKLQLRGAIAIPEAALSRLQSRRADIRVQVCSLFE